MEKQILKFKNKTTQIGSSQMIAIPPPILDALEIKERDELEITIATEGKKKYILMEKAK